MRTNEFQFLIYPNTNNSRTRRRRRLRRKLVQGRVGATAGCRRGRQQVGGTTAVVVLLLLMLQGRLQGRMLRDPPLQFGHGEQSRRAAVLLLRRRGQLLDCIITDAANGVVRRKVGRRVRKAQQGAAGGGRPRIGRAQMTRGKGLTSAVLVAQRRLQPGWIGSVHGIIIVGIALVVTIKV